MNQQPSVVSTQVVTCQLMCMTHAVDDPPVEALLIVYADGHVEVRCPLKSSCDNAKYANPPEYRVCGYEYKS